MGNDVCASDYLYSTCGTSGMRSTNLRSTCRSRDLCSAYYVCSPSDHIRCTGGYSHICRTSSPHDFNDVGSSDYLRSTCGTHDLRHANNICCPSNNIRCASYTHDLNDVCASDYLYSTCGTSDMRSTN